MANAAAEQFLSELKIAQAAAARRKVILDGLGKLGYQVNTELSTATTNGGRLVLQNPSMAGYGVEIVNSASAERTQVRLVAFNAARDTNQDIPAEESWCNDFSSLRQGLKAQGTDVIIDQALGIGTVPLRVLQSPRENEQDASGTKTPQRKESSR